MLGSVKEVEAVNKLSMKLDWLQHRAGPHGFFTYPGTLFGADQGINVIWIVYPTPVLICCQHVRRRSWPIPAHRPWEASVYRRPLGTGAIVKLVLSAGKAVLRAELPGLAAGAPPPRPLGQTHLPLDQPRQLRRLAKFQADVAVNHYLFIFGFPFTFNLFVICLLFSDLK